ncbi:MAG: ABC-F type ribosomal protection protein [Oscillospiraceae bacterium]|nr:ABC-F type ribosomal protection protein [Oscillospiraceae bacterium]
MSQINITNLTFSYDGTFVPIFQNVNLSLDTNWKLGLIGRNGRGKTTLLKLLHGELEYQGNITATCRFDYFPFAVDTIDTIARTLLSSICPEVQEWEIVRELSLLSLNESILDRNFATLSNGERTKLLLAALFCKEHHFLLIDEPTNHLDLQGRQTLSQYLQKKKGYIIVSHDRAFLDGCINHILSINKTNIELQRGNFSSWLINKERQDNFELSENEKLKKDIKRLNEAADRAGDWSDKTEKSKKGAADKGFVGHKAAKMMSKAKNIENRLSKSVEQKSELLHNIERADTLKLTFAFHHAKTLIELRNVVVSYGGRAATRPVSFSLQQGERLLLRGANGAGKSSILKLICGEQLDYTGEMQLVGRLRISYVPQDTSFLRGNLRDFAIGHGLDETLLKTNLRKLDFERESFDHAIETYSAGQKKKVLLAKSLSEQAHILVWDEPLNYVDVFSRFQIETLILDYAPTLLFVEHDSSFIERIATWQLDI